MRSSANAVRSIPPSSIKTPTAVLVRVTSPDRNEAQAYETYRAYCGILETPPLAFDAWRVESRRLFLNSLSSSLRVSRSESVVA
jgi:hypothetical protein